MMDNKRSFLRSIIEPDRKLTPEQEMEYVASRKVDFLIRSMGATAEVLDAQNRQICGKSLRETLMEREIATLREQVEQKRKRQEMDALRKKERDEVAGKEILDLFNENYFLTIDGQRVKKLKKLETCCPHCGTPHSRPRGALIELWDWRRNHQGIPAGYAVDAPVKSASITCKKCGKAFAFTAQVLA